MYVPFHTAANWDREAGTGTRDSTDTPHLHFKQIIFASALTASQAGWLINTAAEVNVCALTPTKERREKKSLCQLLRNAVVAVAVVAAWQGDAVSLCTTHTHTFRETLTYFNLELVIMNYTCRLFAHILHQNHLPVLSPLSLMTDCTAPTLVVRRVLLNLRKTSFSSSTFNLPSLSCRLKHN